MLKLRSAVILLLVLINIAAVVCQRNPTISFISKTTVADIGSVVVLQCSVQYSQEFPVNWIRVDPKNNVHNIISTKSLRIVPDRRFSIRHDPASSQYTLTISNVRQTDNGTYLCEVLIDNVNKITAQVSLLIRLEPVILDNSTLSVVANEGKEVMLECYADGYPKPEITWRRDNSGPLPTGGSIYRGNKLVIKRIKKEDRGTYFCVAQNGVGRGQKRNVNVEVEFVPFIQVRRPKIQQALHYDADLHCEVVAYPPPAIVWQKDGLEINNNQHYGISIWNSAGQVTSSVLRVKSAEKNQFGPYKCLASNVQGSSSETVLLEEVSIKVCPPACDVQTYGGAAVVSAGLTLLTVCLPLLL